MENNAIFGYTGFVGSYLTKFYRFQYLYNSSNIKESVNKEFNIIYISCIPAVKWYANKNPEEDQQVIQNLIKIFKTIEAEKVILISTIDVYDNINNSSNEKTKINHELNHTYGKNRYLFEREIQNIFDDVYIIRLPALFGKDLKKNIIYDLLNNNNTERIPVNSSFQWYNLEWLKDHIEVCLSNKLKVCNLFTEPLETKEILSLKYFKDFNFNNNPAKRLEYNCKTVNNKYFQSGKNGYIMSKEEVLSSLGKYLHNEFNKTKYKLCISNISNNSLNNLQYYSLLKHYGINFIEIAPTKFGEWNELFKCNILEKELNIMKKFNITGYSFQSITYKFTSNIFGNENESNNLYNHLTKVIDLALKNNIRNLVFGCPRNRKVLNKDYNNDKVFIAFFKKLGKYIGDNNLMISIENNSKKYNCNYLNTIKEVGEIVIKINHKNIRMMVDIGNCIMENDNLNDILIYKDLINHIHISMPFMKQFISYNKEEYNKFIGLLRNIDYNKVISLEMLSSEENELSNINKSLNNFVTIFQ